jgi:antitoxin YefM
MRTEMNSPTFREGRPGLQQTLDAVDRDHESTVISMRETLHLLGTPTNADRLRQSVAEWKAGKTSTKDLPKDVATEQRKK